MRFKSDNQRKAVMANIFSKGKFSLYTSGNVLRSTDIPTVNVKVYNDIGGSRDILFDIVSGVDDRHLAGLDYIAVANADDKMLDGKYGRYKTRDKKPAIIVADIGQTGKYDWGDIVTHEIGHHVIRNAYGPTYMRKIGKYGQEVLADEYKKNLIGSDNRYIHPDDEESANLALSYAETLQEIKNPSIKEQMKYADVNFSVNSAAYRNAISDLESDYNDNKIDKEEYDTRLAAIYKQFLGLDAKSKFSYDERRRKGWYPADSNLPREFDNIILNTTFKVLTTRYGHFDPDDEQGKAVITGMVCEELDKNWNPEWGKRPDGHYIRADVEDALERLR